MQRTNNGGGGRPRTNAQINNAIPEPPAKAPYNFVPLNEQVIEGEPAVDFSAYHEGRLSGYIVCEIENLTPLYIRDTLDERQVVKENVESKDNPDFFSPAGRYRIPGSSLRGMVRNLVEIISWGKFSAFDNKLLFYRGLADQSNLQKEYQNNMSSYDRNTRKSIYKFSAGYLTCEGVNNYYIIPAKTDAQGKQFVQVPNSQDSREFVYEFKQDGRTLVISGKMQGKKHDWLINPPEVTQKRFRIPNRDVLDYKMDENRYEDGSTSENREKHDGDLLRMLAVEDRKMVPCFYVCWRDSDGNQRVSFGHTGYFRLAYKKTIGQHVPGDLRKTEQTDIAESIFGKLSHTASRVYFEDAELTDFIKDMVMETKIPRVLSSPKPTTFQHYLKQRGRADVKSLTHWNSEGNIRGYKLYWHKNSNKQDASGKLAWEEDKTIPKNSPIHTEIRPVKPHALFNGRIRFENLTEIELGALLFVLDLPEKHYHKLGMGKPLGLGTVKITPRLYLCDRIERYSELFDEDSWELSENESTISEYKGIFEKHVLNRLSSQEKGQAQSLWDITRMKQLKAMLDYQHANEPEWSEATRYLLIENPGNEYRRRPVLPEPLDVKEQYRKKK